MSELPLSTADVVLLAPRPAVRRSAWAVMRSVLFALYLRELKTRLDGRWGSALWVIGEPLANLVAMLLVYSAVRAVSLGGIDTLMFLVSGLLPFHLFKALVLRLMEGIDANQGLFAYRQVKPLDALLARAGVELTLMMGIVLTCVLGLAWLEHRVLPARPLELLLALAVLVALGSVLGLLAAVATSAHLARARSFVRMAFFPLYLMSGAMVPLAHLPQALREWLLLNPITQLIESIRMAFFGSTYRSPEGVSLALPLAWTLVVAVLALSLYRVRRDRLLPQ